jgi:hypothetical protein
LAAAAVIRHSRQLLLLLVAAAQTELLVQATAALDRLLPEALAVLAAAAALFTKLTALFIGMGLAERELLAKAITAQLAGLQMLVAVAALEGLEALDRPRQAAQEQVVQYLERLFLTLLAALAERLLVLEPLVQPIPAGAVVAGTILLEADRLLLAALADQAL